VDVTVKHDREAVNCELLQESRVLDARLFVAVDRMVEDRDPQLFRCRRPELEERLGERFGMDAGAITKVVIDLPRRVEPEHEEAIVVEDVQCGLVERRQRVRSASDRFAEVGERLEPVAVQLLASDLDGLFPVGDERASASMKRLGSH
jgi:hypothetical protein